MNSNLSKLQPYPFQRLKQALASVTPDKAFKPINLSIGEPKTPPPIFIEEQLAVSSSEIKAYPTTQGTTALRQAISSWLERRFNLEHIDPENQVLPVNGTREALFAIAQLVVNGGKTNSNPFVVMPNPFYQIYEGAAILSGAHPLYLNLLAKDNYQFNFEKVSEKNWNLVQLIYVCTPNNPTGRVLTLADWEKIFEYAEKYDFVIAADECYSEIYFEENKPPIGSLEAAKILGHADYNRLVSFGSLSKRSNVPGLRSGYVAGDQRIIKEFFKYRTYHGSAMSPSTQKASIAAWSDESHVVKNRDHYRRNFSEVIKILESVTSCKRPEAGFYLWLDTPMSSIDFSIKLYEDYNLTVLPGSFLARNNDHIDPGTDKIRIALVSSTEECVDAANRIKQLIVDLK